MNAGTVLVVVGVGPSRVPAIRDTDDVDAWQAFDAAANDDGRRVASETRQEQGAWCVRIPTARVRESDLIADPAVRVYARTN